MTSRERKRNRTFLQNSASPSDNAASWAATRNSAYIPGASTYAKFGAYPSVSLYVRPSLLYGIWHFQTATHPHLPAYSPNSVRTLLIFAVFNISAFASLIISSNRPFDPSKRSRIAPADGTRLIPSARRKNLLSRNNSMSSNAVRPNTSNSKICAYHIRIFDPWLQHFLYRYSVRPPTKSSPFKIFPANTNPALLSNISRLLE